MSNLLYFEDFVPGQTYDLGTLTVSRDDIVEFAAEFDPQPFHLDEAAGEASLLGGLAASGWHTASLVMRLLATGLLNKTAGRGSPGIDTLKWRRPVFPGDTLQATALVQKTKILQTKPDLGIVTVEVTATNQDGNAVLTWINPILFARREVET